jgi:hypothetical protein
MVWTLPSLWKLIVAYHATASVKFKEQFIHLSFCKQNLYMEKYENYATKYGNLVKQLLILISAQKEVILSLYLTVSIFH